MMSAKWPEPFLLYRRVDDTGVSGTGVVASGVRFDDGTVVLRWGGEHASTVVWKSLDDAMAIHGHDGKTTPIWLDAAPKGEAILSEQHRRQITEQHMQSWLDGEETHEGENEEEH